MDDNKKIAYVYLDHAQKALRAGNGSLAKEYCDLAESTAPDLEEVWLLKATLSDPADSIVYIQKALEINPASERAKKGLVWAQQRLGVLGLATTNEENSQIASDEPVQDIAQEVPEAVESLDKNPFKVGTNEDAQVSDENASQTQEFVAATPSVKNNAVSRGDTSWARKWLTPISIIVLLAIIALAAYFNPDLIKNFDSLTNKGGASEVETTTDFPTSTATAIEFASPTTSINLTQTQASEPTNTYQPSPTVTQTATATLIPTNTEIPSRTPLPTTTEIIQTNIPLSNDLVPSPTTQIQALMTVTPNPALEGVPSPTPLPTDTDEPKYSVDPVPTSAVVAPIPNPISGTRWIDVDLTNQMLYAYEGNQMLNAFVVSTGTWQYPTVTGSYNVYVKYLYKDMSGADYYLPDVPYTMFFYEGYAIHGTYWHNNFGIPMSHGCVNMTIPDAAWIYQFASVGTTVNVHY